MDYLGHDQFLVDVFSMQGTVEQALRAHYNFAMRTTPIHRLIGKLLEAY